MLFPHSYAWTPLQKWLIIGAVAMAVGALTAFVYRYERHQRGPTDTVLLGTWESDNIFGLGSVYYRFNPDHTFQVLNEPEDESSKFMRGLWYAGGDFVYMRRPWKDLEADTGYLLYIWRLDYVSPTELQISYNPGGAVHTYRRVDPTHLTNR